MNKEKVTKSQQCCEQYVQQYKSWSETNTVHPQYTKMEGY